ncbi:hypothetical protein J6590_052090 [Homalodisca vitripennis]|nr:hypothetical protein J6590_052090 [Homalodisca vitripennis]
MLQNAKTKRLSFHRLFSRHKKLGLEVLSNTKPEDQRFKGDFRTTTNGRSGGLLARTRSFSDHPSKQQPRSTLLDSAILQ